MEEAKNVVKHVLLATFKETIQPDEVDKIIKDFANLVNLIEPMKSFHWGKDVSTEKLHQGYTHVFECDFESMEGIREYIDHPAHGEFAKEFLPAVEKFIVIDYVPTRVNL